VRRCLANLLIVVVILRGALPLVHAAETEDVAFTANGDATEQRYVLVLPAEFDPKATTSVLIVLHGHGSDRWQFVKDERDECRAARDAAAAHRMIYVSPDYRARTSWMGPTAEADTLQIIDELKGRFRIGKVVISGGSMGGTAALTFAALHPDKVDGVVSMNGTANLVEYAQFQDAISASYGGSKQEKPDEYRKRSAELHADKLTMPIGITTGGLDTLVPPDSVLRMADALQKQNRKLRLIHRPEGGHSTNYADAAAAFEFVLKEVLQPKVAVE
jgi:dipeptidyl aminopeptidase/acylaminoacyl peptidase